MLLQLAIAASHSVETNHTGTMVQQKKRPFLVAIFATHFPPVLLPFFFLLLPSSSSSSPFSSPSQSPASPSPPPFPPPPSCFSMYSFKQAPIRALRRPIVSERRTLASFRTQLGIMAEAKRVRLGFVGAGQMAEALARGMSAAGVVAASDMSAMDLSQERLAVFAEMGVAAKTTCKEVCCFALSHGALVVSNPTSRAT
ncbi:unnamed protein product [Closterium sp. NIES-53]